MVPLLLDLLVNLMQHTLITLVFNHLLGGLFGHKAGFNEFIGVVHVDVDFFIHIGEVRLTRGVLNDTDFRSAKLSLHGLSKY